MLLSHFLQALGFPLVFWVRWRPLFIGATRPPPFTETFPFLSPEPFGIPLCGTDGDYHNLLSHSVKMGGLAVHNPCETAKFALEISKAMTRHLVTSLVKDNVLFNQNEHRRAVLLASVVAGKDCLT